MSGTAALSASVVAGVAQQGGAAFASMRRRSPSSGVLCALAGVLRLGFIASFISEPVLKGFIIGLALTIIIGQVPALLGIDKPPGSFFEKLVGHPRRAGRHRLAHDRGRRAVARGDPRAQALPAAGAGLVGRGAGRHRRRGGVRPRRAGPGHRRPDRRRAAELRGSPRSAWTTTSRLVGPAVGVLLIGFAEGLGRREDLRGQGGLRHRPQRRAARHGRRQRRVRAVRRDGRQRQPVQDRGQRRRRRAGRRSRVSPSRR